MADKIPLLLLSLALALPFQTRAAETANPGDASGTSPDMKIPCQIAGAFRLTYDSMKCDCNASKSCKGGPLPNDAGDCSSPPGSAESTVELGANYKLGARPSFASVIDPSPGNQIDCSGFVSAGLCRAGTPFEPGKPCQDLTTSAMNSDIEGGKSCFVPVQAGGGGGKSNLKPGDLVVYQHAGKAIGHVFMINSVDATDCHKFSIIQSAGQGVGISLANGGPVSGEQGEALKDAEQVSCGGAGEAGAKVKVVRFNGMKPGCMVQPDPKKLKNEACVQSCDVGRMDGHE